MRALYHFAATVALLLALDSPQTQSGEIEARRTYVVPDEQIASLSDAVQKRAARPSITLEGSQVTPEAIEKIAGRDWGTVTIRNARNGVAIIGPLRHATSIRTLRLYGGSLSGQLRRLEHVRGLVALELGAPLTVRDLEAVGRLTQLERLKLPQELALTVTGARQIARLTKLKSLDLYNVDVDDASFVELATLVNLEELNLFHTRVTDVGLQVLAHMPRLKSLHLHRRGAWDIPQQISDACVPVICQLTRLETLSLSGDVTDEGLVKIATLPRLKDLWILNTKISGKGLAALESSTVESLTIGEGVLGGIPIELEKDDDILRSRPGLASIKKCKNLRSVTVMIGILQGDFFSISQQLQRLAPNIGWDFAS